MTEAVLDASVAAKLFLDEEDSELAHAVAAEVDLFAPVLVLPELCNLFWKRLRRGEVSYQDASNAIDMLPGIVELVAIEFLAQPAMRLSALLNHAAYDCFYLALAETRNLRFITTDRRLIDRVRSARLGIETLLLSQFSH